MPQSQLENVICLLPVEWLIIERLLIIGSNSNNSIFMPTLNKLTQFYKIFKRYITKDQYTRICKKFVWIEKKSNRNWTKNKIRNFTMEKCKLHAFMMMINQGNIN